MTWRRRPSLSCQQEGQEARRPRVMRRIVKKEKKKKLEEVTEETRMRRLLEMIKPKKKKKVEERKARKEQGGQHNSRSNKELQVLELLAETTYRCESACVIFEQGRQDRVHTCLSGSLPRQVGGKTIRYVPVDDKRIEWLVTSMRTLYLRRLMAPKLI